jgi:hypothetical protein
VKAVELSERFKTRLLAVRPWCSVDARLGAATVAFTETTVFDGEVHASDACDDTIGTSDSTDITVVAVAVAGSRIDCHKNSDLCILGMHALQCLLSA